MWRPAENHQGSGYSSSKGSIAPRQLTYRPDIDGLRALAVLVVVFFHAEVPGFRGGFVGVDIFFVISGFLISGIILRELKSGEFSLGSFYVRRIRRIIPAFIVVVTATLVAGIAFLPPYDLAQLGSSAAAAAVFASNFYFADHTGYFDEPETAMPLLHTWSLGVEEQFYIIWPLLLACCFWLSGRKAAIFLVIGVLLASLAFAEWFSTTAERVETFYLLQSRAWELMLGAMLSLTILPRVSQRWIGELLALLGLGMIVVAVTQFSRATPHPGLLTLLPCIGAVLIIHSGGVATTTHRVLCLPAFVFIGLISYSLYLWHWPLLTFAKFYVERDFTIIETATLLAISVMLATASWHFVERRFRYQSGMLVSHKPYFLGAGGSLALLAGAGAALLLSNGLPHRIRPEVLEFYLASRAENPHRDACHTEEAAPEKASRCTEPKQTGYYDVLLWGDSHADALFPAITVVAENHSLSARQASKSGCPPVLAAQPMRNGRVWSRGCPDYNRRVLQEVSSVKPALVILAARWSLFLETPQGEYQGETFFLVDKNYQTPNARNSARVLATRLRQTVEAIRRLSIPVLLIGEVPEFSFNPNDCFVRRTIARRADFAGCLNLPRRDAERRLSAAKNILLELGKRPGVTYIGLDDYLCNENVCKAVGETKPLYRDADHLNMWGARLLGRRLSATIIPLIHSKKLTSSTSAEENAKASPMPKGLR